MSEPLLRVQLKAGYGKACVLEDVRFELAAGELLGLCGGSGEGKSTLVLALLGLLPWRGGWAQGEVLLEGVNVLALTERDARRLRGGRIGFVPQSPMSALNGAVSLRKHFEQAWLAHERGLRAQFDERLSALMKQVQLPDSAEFLQRRPGEISVGQAQRVVLALAMLHRPALLIADEPTSALDAVTQAEVLRMLGEIQRAEGIAVLYISHDLLSVLRFCRTLAVLHGGRLVECVPVAALAKGTRHAATEALLRTLPVPLRALLAQATTEVEPTGNQAGEDADADV